MSDELFSYRLRKYRESRNMSPDTLGRALGVTGRYIGMIERGDKDVEPSSSLYKLFSLMESNSVPFSKIENPHDSPVLREDTVSYTAKSKAALSLPDVIAQIRHDLDSIQGGPAAERRRSYSFLRDIHLPLLGQMLELPTE